MYLLPLLKVITFLIFILLSAFFSSAETAFTAINRFKLHTLVEQNVKGAKRLEKILHKPKKLITAVLIGNNLVNIGASAIATAAILDFLKGLGFENYATAMAIVTGIMTLIILTFGEITPKTLAFKNPEKLALFISRPIYYTLIIFNPLIILFTWISKGISVVLGVHSAEVGKILTAEEVKTVVKLAEEEGVLDKDEREMIRSIFEFSETKVREIMTPRTDTVAVDVSSPVTEVIQVIRDSGHSRVPVYEGDIDNIVGIVYAKDLLGVVEPYEKVNLRKFMREAVFIPEMQNIEDLFPQMKKDKNHLAVVVDEYGGMAGLVTMEDILEEIVGEIQDEYDEDDKPEFMELKPGHYRVNARMNISDLEDNISCEFPEEEDYDTIGGFVLRNLGRMPKRNETIEYQDIAIHVTDVSRRRIRTLEIYKIKNSEDKPE
ncbi:hemolysin family protein [Thermoproteota archaeon]